MHASFEKNPHCGIHNVETDEKGAHPSEKKRTNTQRKTEGGYTFL
jgi:hypothetical protein